MSVPSSVPQSRGRTQDHRRWRGRETLRGKLLIALYRHRLKLLWATLLFASLALFTWLIWLLLFAPKRTPFVVLSAAPYAWPLPPNAWAAEDIQKLASLDGKSISLRGSDEPVLSKNGFFDRLEQEISFSHAHNARLPLIIWVNMHGVGTCGDDQNSSKKIYLIPPQSSPTDSATWIDFDELTDRLAQLPPERNTLLILDNQRMQVNWNIGLIANQFSACVQQAFGDRIPRNLAVLLAAGPEQQAAVSPDLRGSTFGHYLQRGLAGAADIQLGSGNRDGWVSLSELHAYVQHSVNQWVAQNRGAQQSPLLLTSTENMNFRLTRSLNQETLEKLLEADRKANRPVPTIAANRLDNLWRQLDELRTLRLYQCEPVAWRNVEHDLLWLEQLSASGEGYRDMALRTYDEVEGRLQAIQGRIEPMKTTRSIRERFTVLSGDNWPLPHGLQVHSVPLAEYFGTRQSKAATELRKVLGKFGEQPNPELLIQTLSTLPSKSATEFSGERFLRMLGRYQYPGLWERPQAVSQLLSLQAAIEDLAVPTDAKGIPEDGRVHRWTRQLVAGVQVARRRAEDSLFSQDQPALAQYLKDTQALVQDATDATQVLRVVMGTCDRAMAETPYLAQWLTHPLHFQNLQEIQPTVDGRLLPLISNTLELSNKMADPLNDSTDFTMVLNEIDDIQQFANSNVVLPFDSLTNEWNLWSSRLLRESETDNPESVGELEAVLSVPLSPWESRRDLRDASNRLAVRLHANYQSGGMRDTDNPTEGQVKANYSSRIDSLKQHPLPAILGLEVGLEAQNRSLAQLFLEEVGNQLSTQSNAASLAAQRTACSVAAGRFRAAAPLWFAAPIRNPVAELRQFDLQSLLIWHTELSLDDFWGPAGLDHAFFDLAASDYIKAAAEYAHMRPLGEASQEAPEIEAPEIEALKLRLAASIRAAQNWIATSAGPKVQLDPSEPVEANITVKATLGQNETVQSGFMPPTGTATLLLWGAAGPIQDATFQPSNSIPLPLADEDIAVTIPAVAARVGVPLQALTVFRGHEYSGPLLVEELEGLTVDVRPYKYDHSQVTLNSPWQKLSVVFILDCSHSMQDALVSGGEGATLSRMEVAKLALQEMLMNLSLRPNVRVGVQFFGHRLGWSTSAPVRPLTRPDLIGVVGADVTASQDVETVLQLGDFDLPAAQAVIPLINAVKPWGQSPLYLSVVQALDDFGDGASDADRHVIVITDGANYQYIPSTESDVQATTDDDVRQAWSPLQIPVHILGLGMDRTQDQKATDEFSQLCNDTGGRFQALTTSTDLNTALSQLLGPGNYSLKPSETNGMPARESALGSPIRLSPAPQTAQRFWLANEGRNFVDPKSEAPTPPQNAVEEILFQGGEALQLYVHEQGTTIHAYPFLENVVAQRNLVTRQGTSTEHIVRIHQPQRKGRDQVTIPISWQRLDTRSNLFEKNWRVTQRPAEVWVEVQPMTSRDEPIGQEYVFCDANYEPDQPVPLLNLVASDWPQAASRAQVRVWCQPPPEANFELPSPRTARIASATSTNFLTRVAVNEALQFPTAIAPSVTLRIAPPASDQQAEFRQLRFVLNFEDANLPVNSFKLSIPRGTRAQPTRIVRQYDIPHRMAVHTFYFDKSRDALPEVIEVSNREHEFDGAWRMEQEYPVVDVFRSETYLPVTVTDSH